MKGERALRYALVLSLAYATMSLPQATLARGDADTLHPPAATPKKGTAHIGCVYTIYLTIQSTLEICFPDKYLVLHRHVDKWIPIMRKYSDENAINEHQKLDTDDYNIAMEKFRKSLDEHACNQYRSFIEQFSKALTENVAKTERGLEEMLQKSDEPKVNYGCL